ncbi:TPA: hypothetical protein EYO12_02560 [Candidatus Saccharibacteria bacterium]|nr:hypothetical protein [Candidatus Saccharibacteria bacterium]
MVSRLSVLQKMMLMVVIATVSIFGFTSLANGQNSQGNGLALSTLVEEAEAEPGQRITLQNPITVKNVTANPLTVVVNFNDFLPSEDESGTPQIIVKESTEPNEFGIRTYFQPIDSFTLQPDETIDIPVTLDVPTNATPGGHYGIVRFTAANEADPDQDVTLAASVGTIVLLNVAGEEVENLSLLEIGAAKDGELGSFFTASPDQIVARIQNNGNTHAAPFGRIEVSNFVGNVKEVVEFNSDNTRRGFALPDSIRRFENDLSEKYQFGRYTIAGNLSYGDGGDIIAVNETFWVLPWPIILGVVGGLIVIIGGGRLFLKSYAKKVQNKSRRF